MRDTLIIELAQRGILTLPKALRERYHLEPGSSFTLLDLGGVFVLSLRRSEIDAIADKLKDELINRGETLESLLQALREERDQYGV